MTVYRMSGIVIVFRLNKAREDFDIKNPSITTRKVRVPKDQYNKEYNSDPEAKSHRIGFLNNIQLSVRPQLHIRRGEGRLDTRNASPSHTPVGRDCPSSSYALPFPGPRLSVCTVRNRSVVRGRSPVGRRDDVFAKKRVRPPRFTRNIVRRKRKIDYLDTRNIIKFSSTPPSRIVPVFTERSHHRYRGRGFRRPYVRPSFTRRMTDVVPRPRGGSPPPSERAGEFRAGGGRLRKRGIFNDPEQNRDHDRE